MVKVYNFTFFLEIANYNTEDFLDGHWYGVFFPSVFIQHLECSLRSSSMDSNQTALDWK